MASLAGVFDAASVANVHAAMTRAANSRRDQIGARKSGSPGLTVVGIYVAQGYKKETAKGKKGIAYPVTSGTLLPLEFEGVPVNLGSISADHMSAKVFRCESVKVKAEDGTEKYEDKVDSATVYNLRAGSIASMIDFEVVSYVVGGKPVALRTGTVVRVANLRPSQYFNAEKGQFATRADGSPAVHWNSSGAIEEVRMPVHDMLARWAAGASVADFVPPLAAPVYTTKDGKTGTSSVHTPVVLGVPHMANLAAGIQVQTLGYVGPVHTISDGLENKKYIDSKGVYGVLASRGGTTALYAFMTVCYENALKPGYGVSLSSSWSAFGLAIIRAARGIAMLRWPKAEEDPTVAVAVADAAGSAYPSAHRVAAVADLTMLLVDPTAMRAFPEISAERVSALMDGYEANAGNMKLATCIANTDNTRAAVFMNESTSAHVMLRNPDKYSFHAMTRTPLRSGETVESYVANGRESDPSYDVLQNVGVWAVLRDARPMPEIGVRDNAAFDLGDMADFDAAASAAAAAPKAESAAAVAGAAAPAAAGATASATEDATTADAGDAGVKLNAPADSDLEDEAGDEFDKPLTGKKRGSKQAEGQRVRAHK